MGFAFQETCKPKSHVHQHLQCLAEQVFRPLYYWILACKGCREKMAEKPQNYLKPSRLAGNAFMLHPYKMGWRGLTDGKY